MVDYQKIYSVLFNAMTDAIHVLQKAQQDTEEMYILTKELESSADAGDCGFLNQVQDRLSPQ